MPRKINSKDRAKFWRIYESGSSIREAAKRAGFSESFGRGLIREGRGDNSTRNSRPDRFRREDEGPSGPIPLDELSDIAKDCLVDFGRFRARYLGSMSLPWQEEAGHRVKGLYQTDEDEYVVFNEPQGAGKTRLGHDINAWLTTIDRALRGIYGSLGLKLSASLVSNLRDTFSRDLPVMARDLLKARGLATDAQATLASDYGPFRPTADEAAMWRREQFVVAQHGGVASADKEPTWASFSYEAKFLGWRADLMVWDDLVNTAMLRNPEQVEALYRWWDDEAESRLEPGGLLLLIGQRLRSNDIYRYCLDKAAITDELDYEGMPTEYVPRQYTHIVYKAHYDEICQGEHGRDAPAYLEGGCMLDPKRITWQKIRAKQNAGNYAVVYQQEDTDPQEVLVPKVWIEGGLHHGVTYPGCIDVDRALLEIPAMQPGSFALRIMTVDPSPTKWWGILDWLYVLPPDVEPLAGNRYLMNICRARMGANEFLDFSPAQDAFIGLAEDWVRDAKLAGFPISHVIIERNAAQRWAMQYEFFTNWARTRGVQVVQHDTGSNKADDEFGVRQVIPRAYQHGRVRLPGDPATGSRLKMWPLVQELTTYPHGATDDLVMSNWFLEYNLQHLVHQRRRFATLDTDMPSWARQLEVAGAFG
jgi:hypothetical protein